MKPYASDIAPANHIHAKNYIHTMARADWPIVKIAVFLQAKQATISARFAYEDSVFVLKVLVTRKWMTVIFLGFKTSVMKLLSQFSFPL